MVLFKEGSLQNAAVIIIVVTVFTTVAYAWFLVFESAVRIISGGEFQLNLLHVIFITAIIAFSIIVLLGTSIYELPALSVDEALIAGILEA